MSTSKSPARKYHHGGLRAELVAQGLRLVEESGADAVSLREVARAAGVSATAVYRHFPDKRALMTALAVEGTARLTAAQDAAAAGETDRKAAFDATGRAYVRFALANPGLFRLIFTYPGIALADPTRDATVSTLHANALDAAGGDPDAARLVAIRAWAIVHGLAMLMLDGRLPRDPALVDAAIDSAAVAPKPC